MQLFTTFLTLTTLLLTPLVSSEACVAGGPTNQVTYAKGCCYQSSGTWYQFYDNQAICVFPDARVSSYKRCISYIPYSQLDTTCIPGDGGLGYPSTTLSTSTSRETITASGTGAAANPSLG